MRSKILVALLAVCALAGAVWAYDGPTLKETYFTPVGGDYEPTPTTLTAAAQNEAFRIDAWHNLNVVPALNTAWHITAAAAVNATPTATQAAGASGVRHCLSELDYSAWQDATGTVSGAAGFTIAVRDGAAGVGTVIWSRTLSFPLAADGTSKEGQVSFPVPLVGSAATAMTVEFISAALAHTGETVNANGFDTK